MRTHILQEPNRATWFDHPTEFPKGGHLKFRLPNSFCSLSSQTPGGFRGQGRLPLPALSGRSKLKTILARCACLTNVSNRRRRIATQLRVEQNPSSAARGAEGEAQ